MSYNKYRPDYSALYPGLAISEEIMQVLRKSDRKMEYMERDIKTARSIEPRDKSGGKKETNPVIMPAREDSYDRLLENDHEFDGGEATPEQELMQKTGLEVLGSCLEQLNEDEKALVKYLFYHELTEQEISKYIGISQQAVNKRKAKLLAKLKKMMNS